MTIASLLVTLREIDYESARHYEELLGQPAESANTTCVEEWAKMPPTGVLLAKHAVSMGRNEFTTQAGLELARILAETDTAVFDRFSSPDALLAKVEPHIYRLARLVVSDPSSALLNASEATIAASRHDGFGAGWRKAAKAMELDVLELSKLIDSPPRSCKTVKQKMLEHLPAAVMPRHDEIAQTVITKAIARDQWVTQRKASISTLQRALDALHEQLDGQDYRQDARRIAIALYGTEERWSVNATTDTAATIQHQTRHARFYEKLLDWRKANGITDTGHPFGTEASVGADEETIISDVTGLALATVHQALTSGETQLGRSGRGPDR